MNSEILVYLKENQNKEIQINDPKILYLSKKIVSMFSELVTEKAKKIIKKLEEIQDELQFLGNIKKSSKIEYRIYFDFQNDEVILEVILKTESEKIKSEIQLLKVEFGIDSLEYQLLKSILQLERKQLLSDIPKI